MPTIRDVARESGVSIATVSVVLSGSPRTVAPATREKVLMVAHELQYRPNRSARALSTGKTFLIALWISEVRRAYFSTIAQQIEYEIRQVGYDYLRIGGGHDRDAGEWCGTCDGILALDSPDSVRAYMEARTRMAKLGRGTLPPPLVGLGTKVCTDVDFVAVNLEHGARLATERLITQGCRRIAFVTPTALPEHHQARRNGYKQAMRSAGREPEYLTIGGQASRANARRATLEYVARSGCPDGLFCYSDDVAVGTYRALHDLNLRIPDDARIIGCDGIEEGEYLCPSLSTIMQPYAQQVKRSVELLCRRIAEPDAPLVQEWLLPELVVRESC